MLYVGSFVSDNLFRGERNPEPIPTSRHYACLPAAARQVKLDEVSWKGAEAFSNRKKIFRDSLWMSRVP